jgi:hypothetical protein
MMKLLEAGHGKVLIVELSGTLTEDDLKRCFAEAELLITEHGTIRVLCHIHDSPGWEVGALWEEIKFDLKHFADIERLALVGDLGERRWQHGMALFCKPFTLTKVRRFHQIEFEAAVRWIWADLPQADGTEHLQHRDWGNCPATF